MACFAAYSWRFLSGCGGGVTPRWQRVGDADIAQGLAMEVSLAVYNGVPYVAYRDTENGNKATVRRYNGSAWEPVGSAGFSEGVAYYTSLVVLAGAPYVAFRDGSASDKATVMKYTGNGATGWEYVGSRGFSAGGVEDASLAADGGALYVAYKDCSAAYNVTVMKYTGSGATGWEYVGSQSFSPNEAGNLSLAVHNGAPYVSFQDGGVNYGITVMKYTGGGTTGWEYVGNRGFSAGDISKARLKVYNGLPYVAYDDGSLSYKATVMKYTGSGTTGWETIGTSGFSADQAEEISLDVYNGVPYVAYKDQSANSKATVMVFNGADWIPVGNQGISTGQIGNISLVVHIGVPYVTFYDETDGLTVLKYAP